LKLLKQGLIDERYRRQEKNDPRQEKGTESEKFT